MFSDYSLQDNLENFLSSIKKEIESDRKVSEISEEDYIKNKTNQYKIEPITLFIDKLSVSQKEFPIPAEYFPFNFSMEKGEKYPKPVLIFHLPFRGNPQWLRCRPNPFLMWTEEIAILSGEINFELINFNNDAELIKKERDQFLNNLDKQIGYINNQIISYNENLEGVIRDSYNKAKAKFKDQDDFLSQLGNPTK